MKKISHFSAKKSLVFPKMSLVFRKKWLILFRKSLVFQLQSLVSSYKGVVGVGELCCSLAKPLTATKIAALFHRKQKLG